MIIGYPPGQATDIVGRLVADKLSQNLGQPVIVENKPGQGASLALAQLTKAKPDGYTLVLSATAAYVTNPHLYKAVGYDTLKDFKRSEEHTSELQSLMRISYAVFCLKKKTT